MRGLVTLNMKVIAEKKLTDADEFFIESHTENHQRIFDTSALVVNLTGVQHHLKLSYKGPCQLYICRNSRLSSDLTSVGKRTF